MYCVHTQKGVLYNHKGNEKRMQKTTKSKLIKQVDRFRIVYETPRGKKEYNAADLLAIFISRIGKELESKQIMYFKEK